MWAVPDAPPLRPLGSEPVTEGEEVRWSRVQDGQGDTAGGDVVVEGSPALHDDPFVAFAASLTTCSALPA